MPFGSGFAAGASAALGRRQRQLQERQLQMQEHQNDIQMANEAINQGLETMTNVMQAHVQSGRPLDDPNLQEFIAAERESLMRTASMAQTVPHMRGAVMGPERLRARLESLQGQIVTPERETQIEAERAGAIAGAQAEARAQQGTAGTAEMQTFEHLAGAAGLEAGERERAARIQLGLEPRAAGGGQQIQWVRGQDGLDRPARFNPQTGQLEVFEGQQWVGADESQFSRSPIEDAASLPAPEAQTPQERAGLFIGRSPEEEAARIAEATPPNGFRFNDRGELVPIPGGPAHQERIATEQAKQQRIQNIRTRGRTVLRDTQRSLEALESAAAAGPLAGQTRVIPGTPAFRLNQHLESIKSNISIDQLQQMRESSPTGGALGQIPVRQQEFLMQVLGSLDPRLDAEVLGENLRDIYNIYLDAMYGDPLEVAEAVRDERMTPEEADRLMAEREATAFNEFGRRTDIPRIETDEEFEALESGAEFIAPDGTKRRKP